MKMNVKNVVSCLEDLKNITKSEKYKYNLSIAIETLYDLQVAHQLE